MKKILLGVVITGLLSCTPALTEKEKKCLIKAHLALYAHGAYLPKAAEIQRDFFTMLVARGMDVCEAWKVVSEVQNNWTKGASLEKASASSKERTSLEKLQEEGL